MPAQQRVAATDTYMRDVQQRIEWFVQLLSGNLGSRLHCVVLTGSHARGDAQAASDIDLWVFLDHVSNTDLASVGTTIEQLGPGREMNPQCTSFAEVQSSAFRNQFNPMQLHLDGVVVYGRLELPKPGRADVLAETGALAAAVLMSARHYITVREAEPRLAQGRLERWVLKPLMWALRYEAYARLGVYPRSLDNLAESAFSPAATGLVQTYQQVLERRFAGPWMAAVLQAHDVAAGLLSLAGSGRQAPGQFPRERGVQPS